MNPIINLRVEKNLMKMKQWLWVQKSVNDKKKNKNKLTYFLNTGKSGAMTGISKVIALINNGGKPCTS
jgi:hypothetical protein